MNRISIIFIIVAIVSTSFFSCQKENNFIEEDINLDNPPTVWKVLKEENSDLLSNSIKSIKHQKSTGLIWFLTEAGLQSFDGSDFTTYNDFANVSEIYWDSEQTLIYKKAASYRHFNTTTQKTSSATELDWNKAKHGIDFTYGTIHTSNTQQLIVEHKNNTEVYNFEEIITNEIKAESEQLSFTTFNVINFVPDTALFVALKAAQGALGICNELDTLPIELYNSYSLNFDTCAFEIVDTIFEITEKALLSDGRKASFNLNEYNEKPTAYKFITYNTSNIPFLKQLGFQNENLGSKTCWEYPSNESCTSSLEIDFNFKQAAVDKNGLIYLKFNDRLLIYNEGVFNAILFELSEYNFLLLDGEVFLTNKNSLLKIENTNSIQNLYTSNVDCWVFGNQELQGFTKIEDVLWIANCENIVRCEQNNCERRRVEHPDLNFFELRSNAVEVINDSLIWIGYNTNGAYLVEWNDL